ncbi:MAG: hypothetical protein JW841_15365 [Deltaproteobacteria bacterium]|nr:hypothetical protein [Deltaproteobacteria bacterium]
MTTFSNISFEEQLWRLAQGYLTSGEPVSFYDAFTLIRLARRSDNLSEKTLQYLISVFDHETTTNGGKGVLADFLRALTQRQNKQRARAERIISIRDHDTTIRTFVGATLYILVSDATATADDWSVICLEGPAQLTRLSPIRAQSLNADFELFLVNQGQVSLELCTLKTERNIRDKRLKLLIIVESKNT